jgi:hypothetical protein
MRTISIKSDTCTGSDNSTRWTYITLRGASPVSPVSTNDSLGK